MTVCIKPESTEPHQRVSEGASRAIAACELGHRATRDVDDLLSTITSTTDINGVRTIFTKYDGFGRLEKSISPTGIETVNTVEWANGELVSNQKVAFKSFERSGELPPIETLLDLQGRGLRTKSITMENRIVYGTRTARPPRSNTHEWKSL